MSQVSLGAASSVTETSIASSVASDPDDTPNSKYSDIHDCFEDKHVYHIASPDFMYQFKGASGLFIGYEDKVRPPPEIANRWQSRIAPRLWTDLREFQNKMRSKKSVGLHQDWNHSFACPVAQTLPQQKSPCHLVYGFYTTNDDGRSILKGLLRRWTG
jgi:hypothetical protein